MLDFIQNTLGDVGSVASVLTISVTLMGAAALLLSNLARYTQAKKFGIPIKAVSQATMGDSAAIWILLIRALGFGVLIPLAMFSTSWSWWFLLPAAAISFFFALTSELVSRIIRTKKNVFKGKTYIVEKEGMYKYIAVISVLMSFAYWQMHSTYHVIYAGGRFAEGFLGHTRFFLGVIGMAIYALLLAYIFYSGIKTIIFGGNESMVVVIEDQKYLVAMRNSHYHWILVPCEPDVVILKQFKKGGYRSKYVMRFEKGTFIIRDMSTINASIKRMKYYAPVDMGVPEDELVEEEEYLLGGKNKKQETENGK